jgi:pimeloyl-ACP methyl ester carboxylesterase
LKIFEETGHYITIEEPEIVNKQITEWLESLKIHLR